jgi:DNA polymerase-3 subunit beta
MEFSVKKFDLLDELNLTQGVVERKTTIPILGNILCEASGNRITLTATDLELSIRTSCEAKVKKEGAGTIHAKKLLELVRLLPEGEIRFKLLENHWVQILADRKTYKMVGMAKDNFPAIPAFPHTIATIPAKILSSLIARTSFAISNEESRYTLNGALLLLKPEMVTMVATDGHAKYGPWFPRKHSRKSSDWRPKRARMLKLNSRWTRATCSSAPANAC